MKSALLIAWCRQRFGGQGRAGRHFDDVVRRPAGRQPLPSVAGRGAARRRHAHQSFGPHRGRDLRRGARRTLGLDRALARAGWRARHWPAFAVDRSRQQPVLEPSHIVSVLGETDRWVPYDDGLAVTEQWRLPPANVFRYPLGHLGMPVQLTRDEHRSSASGRCWPARDVEAGDLAHQLGAHGAAEMVEVVGHDHERARSADDVLLVVLVEGEYRAGGRSWCGSSSPAGR